MRLTGIRRTEPRKLPAHHGRRHGLRPRSVAPQGLLLADNRDHVRNESVSPSGNGSHRRPLMPVERGSVPHDGATPGECLVQPRQARPAARGFARWSAGRPHSRRSSSEPPRHRLRTDERALPAAGGPAITSSRGKFPFRHRQVVAVRLGRSVQPARGERRPVPRRSTGRGRRSRMSGKASAHRVAHATGPRRAARLPQRAAPTTRQWLASLDSGRDRVQHAESAAMRAGSGRLAVRRPESPGSSRACSPTRSATRRASGIPSRAKPSP